MSRPTPDLQSKADPNVIRVRGARQNNLRGLDVAFPKRRLTVVTGVSGSGKSSLVFDTLYAEGQRRYVESFSTYARQFLERMDRPDVDAIDGLLPAVAIEQKNTIRSARSTLGSLTEVNDFLKVLFAAEAVLYCPTCGQPVIPDQPGDVADGLLAERDGQRLVVTFPFHAGEGDDARVALAYLEREGFRRVWRGGATVEVTDLDPDEGLGRLEVIVDRLVVREIDRARLVESIETAYRMGEDDATLHFDAREGGGQREVTRERRCCGRTFSEPRPGMFSWSSPLGACPECNGFGRVMDIDMDRVVPDHRKTIDEGAIRPWRSKKRSRERRVLQRYCEEAGIPTDVPWGELPEHARESLLEGLPGRQSWRSGWPGVRAWFQKLQRKVYKMHVRILLARYRAYLECPECDGTRFVPEPLWYRLGGLNVAETLAQPVGAAREWLASIGTADSVDEAVRPVFEQLEGRLGYLDRVGLEYLTLDRQARTLSGGEVQRANLTTALGSGLVNTLFVFDEPSVGLHPRDADRLAGLLSELTERDNTVVLVEHDPDVLRYADHVVEMGPGPGSDGGTVVFSGLPGELARSEAAATGRALQARREPRSAAERDCSGDAALVVVGARAQNLKGVDVRLPLGKLTVLTGVSGSGKSTFVEEVLYRGILRARGEVTDPPGEHERIEGLERIGDLVQVDQAPPAASPRANPATYVKAWDDIRRTFAKQPLSKERGYTAGTFSFNSGQGRCPACDGAGVERVEMQFLSDVFLTCQLCEGKRFVPEVLEVRWKGRNIADMLQLTVDEAAALMGKKSAAARKLGALSDVGLGYLRLGQPLATLSGGESQRVKIAQHLNMAPAPSPQQRGALVLLDEPTTGLHLSDVEVLIDNLLRLREAGNTVVVIEHHLDVIATADHVIDLGPEGGEGGGEIVFEGPPTALAKADTHTGRHLRAWLAGFEADLTAEPRPEPLGDKAETISVVGARVHNLKNVSVALPRRGRTVISGVSGSGKSSLAFDLVFAEGQRRFLDCLSSYARQYIAQMSRPDADRVEGIPPTVAIEQRTTRGGSQSTVANVTEIEPFLRILFARLGRRRATGSEYDAEGLAEDLGTRHATHELTVCAPAVERRKGYHRQVFAKAARLGHRTIVVDDAEVSPDPPPKLAKTRFHSIDYVVGKVPGGAEDRLAAMINEASLLGQGRVRIRDDRGRVRTYQVVPEHPEDVPRPSLDPRLFSPRTELGGCPRCEGRGELDDGAVCPSCGGERLGEIGRSVRFAGVRLPELLAMTPGELLVFLDGARLDTRERAVATGPFKAIAERASFLLDVGLDYLTLDRGVPTLSGGELQRIRLAAQLGAHLSGVLYVLDEPTIGLHPTDVETLLRSLDRLQERGNGVLMVEHDEATLRTADILVDMGPGAGVEGGEILVAGPLEEALASEASITGRCLREPRPKVRSEPRPLDGVTFIELEGVRHHNLDGEDVRIPRGRFTVVSGVSGSGKSSLVNDVLAEAVAPGKGAGTWARVAGTAGLERYVHVDDKPIGKNPRSTPSTYVGVWDHVRAMFAKLPEAKLRGFTKSRFSFNVKGGRCDTCDGAGSLKLEMSFLPDTYVTCDACGGRRFNRQTLRIQWDGHSIHDVLDMPVREAAEVFERVPKVARGLKLMDDVGLGYLTLGQPSPTLSGGEAQRIKLVSELIGRSRADTVIVLDEPSTGLHMADVPRLLNVFHRLVDAGATVVVIEHNPDIIREADWVIDMGPGGGVHGGRVVYQGPFEGLTGAEESRTGAWFRANASTARAR